MQIIHLVDPKIEIEVLSGPGNCLHTRYKGSQENLVDAGLASDEMFPIWPKRKRWNLGPDIPFEQQWTVERKRNAQFELVLCHGIRNNFSDSEIEVKNTGDNVLEFRPKNLGYHSVSERIKQDIERRRAEPPGHKPPKEVLRDIADASEIWAEHLSSVEPDVEGATEYLVQLTGYIRNWIE